MDINVQELKEKIAAGEEFVLVDVREPQEHQEFNVGGTLIPLGTIPVRLDEVTTNKDAEVVVYCRSGGRSGRAKQFLMQQGFSNVRNLEGGMLAWIDTFGTEK